jgi:hypothetical protein
LTLYQVSFNLVWGHRLSDPPHFGAFETLGASQPHTAMPRRQNVSKVFLKKKNPSQPHTAPARRQNVSKVSSPLEEEDTCHMRTSIISSSSYDMYQLSFIFVCSRKALNAGF